MDAESGAVHVGTVSVTVPPVLAWVVTDLLSTDPVPVITLTSDPNRYCGVVGKRSMSPVSVRVVVDPPAAVPLMLSSMCSAIRTLVVARERPIVGAAI